MSELDAALARMMQEHAHGTGAELLADMLPLLATVLDLNAGADRLLASNPRLTMSAGVAAGTKRRKSDSSEPVVAELKPGAIFALRVLCAMLDHVAISPHAIPRLDLLVQQCQVSALPCIGCIYLAQLEIGVPLCRLALERGQSDTKQAAVLSTIAAINRLRFRKSLG